ncbi:hypothetical protein CJ483_04280 [Bacillus sp. PK3_68]|nr:hypothetical protein CJ483_04280 [Bacillus sp. PK3_68]
MTGFAWLLDKHEQRIYPLSSTYYERVGPFFMLVHGQKVFIHKITVPLAKSSGTIPTFIKMGHFKNQR